MVTQPRVNKNSLFAYTHTLRANLYNDFRIGYHRIDFDTLNYFSVGGIPTAGAVSSANVFADVNYPGAAAALKVGSYTTSQLQAAGIGGDSISSLHSWTFTHASHRHPLSSSS